VRLTSAESRPDPKTVRVEPYTVIQWRVESGKTPQTPATNGESTVRADGTLDLGPYGAVPVAGLTLQQTSEAIAKHLSKYIKDPHVHLKGYVRNAQPGLAGSPSAGAAVAHTAPSPLRERPPQGGPVARTGYQPGPVPQPDVTTAAVPVNPSPADALITGAPPDDQGAGKPAADAKQPEKKASAPAADVAGTVVPGEFGPHLPHSDPHGGPDGAPNELSKISLPPYVIEAPDILLVEYVTESEGIFKYFAIRGAHLVRPDGTISLGPAGGVYVNGMTLEQAKAAIFARLQEWVRENTKEKADLRPGNLTVDVLAYNSKYYYVITDGAGYGEQIVRFPITGNETVLDALAQIGGLPLVASKKHIWVARRVPDHGPPMILPVDYIGTTQAGLAGTNFQVMPGDRIYVKADCLRTLDTNVAKFLSPIERVFGFTLLGAETVTAVKAASRSTGGGTGTGTTP
jgi:polysaccharide export outer membrane protein